MSTQMSVADELREVERSFNKYRSLESEQRSGDTAKKLIQVPVEMFLGRGLSSAFRTGDGDRPPNPNAVRRDDMDIAIDDANCEWDGRTRFLAAGESVRVHIEVGAYDRWSSKKVTADLDSLQRSIRDANAEGRKCWTALALVGGEWSGAHDEIADFLHEYYHRTTLVRAGVAPPYSYSWPFVDAIVLPGLYFMKHDLFEQDQKGTLPSLDEMAAWPAWPFLVEYPLSIDDELVGVRPLAIARAFMHRYLRSVERNAIEEDLVATSDTKTDVLGPQPSDEQLTEWLERGNWLCLQDGAPSRLLHWGKAWSPLERAANACTRASSFRFVRSKPTSGR